MSSSALFVRNKTEEFVGHVICSKQNTIPEKLVIQDYTRDEKVMACQSSADCFTIKCENNKFVGLTKYLIDRKKAAVVKIIRSGGEKDDTLYIIPPSSGVTEAPCIFRSNINVMLSKPSSPHQQQNIETHKPPLGQQNNNEQEHKKALSKSHTTNQQPSFLSNLLSRAESDITSRKSHPKPTLVKAEVLTAVQKLQTRVRDALISLEQDDTKTQQEFEPMEPQQRYLVHEVADDFENLVAQSIGEDIERHVVVYKKGHEPVEEEETPPQPLVPMTVANRIGTKKKAHDISAPKPSNLVKVAVVKRDRRTIEEVQNEMKKRKVE